MPVKLGKLARYFGKQEFVEILIGHIVVLDLSGGFHDSFHQRANIHNRGVLLVEAVMETAGKIKNDKFLQIPVCKSQ